MSACTFDGCSNSASLRCSRCKLAYYCCGDHQKSDWRRHKSECQSQITSASSSTPSVAKTYTSQTILKENNVETSEKRSCRCMFCGDEMILSSEEEAIDHMKVCPALQEQLDSKEQFTIPKVLQQKMKK
jgi:hypothetical protein